MYSLLDILFLAFHSSLIIFNMLGWAIKPLRKLNLASLVLTALSWLLLGWITGIPGYCPLTDWHFRVLTKLGVHNLPDSYIKYLFDRLLNTDFNSGLINTLTASGLVAATIISLILNIRDWKLKRINRA